MNNEQRERKSDQEADKERRRENFRQDWKSTAKYSKQQVTTYVLLLIGFIALFFNMELGGLLIGLVAGYHFAREIFYYIRYLGQMLQGQYHLRSITLAVTLLALFIAVPALFIGALIAAFFRRMVGGD
jgi:hypothetical protein